MLRVRNDVTSFDRTHAGLSGRFWCHVRSSARDRLEGYPVVEFDRDAAKAASHPRKHDSNFERAPTARTVQRAKSAPGAMHNHSNH